jgi:hypothetical protein
VKKGWWRWWLKWYTIAGFVVLVITIFSEPPRLWFWLAVLVALIVYGFERYLGGDA